MAQSRTWLLTLNNPEEDPQVFLQRIHDAMKARYTVGQLEEGENGTPHVQFFMNFPRAVRPAAFKKFMPSIHYEKVKRTPNSAADYCMKEDTRVSGPWEYGDRPVQRNSKTDWKAVLHNAKVGLIENIPDDIIVKHYGNLKRI